jgi:hypothetical protein
MRNDDKQYYIGQTKEGAVILQTFGTAGCELKLSIIHDLLLTILDELKRKHNVHN